MEKKIYKNAVLFTKFVSWHVAIFVKVVHSRQAVCYIVVLVAIVHHQVPLDRALYFLKV
jgi:hypothetical protein